MTPRLFEKRKSTVEAWHWTGDRAEGELIVDWMLNSSRNGLPYVHPHEDLIIISEDAAAVVPGQWIVRDKYNEFWPLDDDVFHSVYASLFND